MKMRKERCVNRSFTATFYDELLNSCCVKLPTVAKCQDCASSSTCRFFTVQHSYIAATCPYCQMGNKCCRDGVVLMFSGQLFHLLSLIIFCQLIVSLVFLEGI